jgi:DoxX-like family
VFTAYVTVTIVTILANAAIVVADLRRAEFVVANSNEVGVPLSSLPLLATLKTAGVAGLLLGLLGVPIVGIAAAVGLILFFTGALITHMRAGVLYNLYFPGMYWALASGSLALAIAH